MRFTPISLKPLKVSSSRLPRDQPELLARHCTEAGLIEKAAGFWGKAGQRSLERSAWSKPRQLTRALGQIADPALPRPRLRREADQASSCAHNSAHPHQRLCRARRTKAAAERARLLIEQAEAIGEAPEDPLLLFSVLYGLWVAQAVAFTDSDVVLELATQCLALAERRGATIPLMIGHRLMGTSLLYTGDLVGSREHLRSSDRAV